MSARDWKAIAPTEDDCVGSCDDLTLGESRSAILRQLEGREVVVQAERGGFQALVFGWLRRSGKAHWTVANAGIGGRPDGIAMFEEAEVCAAEDREVVGAQWPRIYVGTREHDRPRDHMLWLRKVSGGEGHVALVAIAVGRRGDEPEIPGGDPSVLN